MDKRSTYDHRTLKKLFRNVPAMISLLIILVTVIAGIFAYEIIPDSSPNADRQIVEIQAMKPGYSKLFLRLIKPGTSDNKSIFSEFMYGKEDLFSYIPINSFLIRSDSIEAQKFVDTDVSEKIIVSRKAVPAVMPVVRKTFWLGTDRFGRDIVSRLVLGIRVSLSVGLVCVLLSLIIGTVLGIAAGYYGGKTDAAITWLINVIWSIPTLLLVFGITLALGKGFWQIFIAVGLTMWVNVARMTRGQTLVIKQLEYIQAARALGYSNIRIMARHILPNLSGPLFVIGASNFASAIIIEAGLSFLGIGVQPPQPSWGTMIKDNYNFIITHNPILALAPGFAIMIVVLAFNILGNGLRDAFDVRN